MDDSLRHLDIDYIDLYQIHGPNPFTPMEEMSKALYDSVLAWQVRHIGCGNLAVSQGQHMCSLAKRDAEREILSACTDQGMGLLCWLPLGVG